MYFAGGIDIHAAAARKATNAALMKPMVHEGGVVFIFRGVIYFFG